MIREQSGPIVTSTRIDLLRLFYLRDHFPHSFSEVGVRVRRHFGKPTEPGSFNVVLNVSNGAQASSDFTIVINPPVINATPSPAIATEFPLCRLRLDGDRRVPPTYLEQYGGHVAGRDDDQ